MKRHPESRQLMDDVAQARAYAESDFTVSHNRFIDLFATAHPEFDGGRVLDIGCGNGDPTLRFIQRFPESAMIGIDGSAPMLELARKAVDEAGLSHRIWFKKMMVNELNYALGPFDALISNSLLHHLDDPMELWRAARLVKPGGAIFVMDLTRPPSRRAARTLVGEHKEDPKLMRRDFYVSLRAAFRPEEVRLQLDLAGLNDLHVEVVSNRHMAIHGKR